MPQAEVSRDAVNGVVRVKLYKGNECHRQAITKFTYNADLVTLKKVLLTMITTTHKALSD